MYGARVTVGYQATIEAEGYLLELSVLGQGTIFLIDAITAKSRSDHDGERELDQDRATIEE